MSGLQITGLTYAYGEKRALQDVSFTIEQGRFCALLGPNGAGKSTLFSLLTRLFTAPQGKIVLAGADLTQTPRAALARIGVVFQQPTLDLDLTVEQNLRYFAALHGRSSAEAARCIDAALERLDMSERRFERARNLNGGHRRRAEIARALIHDPPVLLLDEPTVGLDAASRRALTEHVHALSFDAGKTVLWATHLTDEVKDSDQLVLLHRGEVLADGPSADLRGEMPLAEYFLTQTGAIA